MRTYVRGSLGALTEPPGERPLFTHSAAYAAYRGRVSAVEPSRYWATWRLFYAPAPLFAYCQEIWRCALYTSGSRMGHSHHRHFAMKRVRQNKTCSNEEHNNLIAHRRVSAQRTADQVAALEGDEDSPQMRLLRNQLLRESSEQRGTLPTRW